MPLTDLITPQWLKDRFLVGIDLTDDDGNEYPEGHYRHAIDMAIAHAESKYDVVLRSSRLCTFRERADTTWADGETWYLTLSEKRPLIEVTRFAVQFGTFPDSEVPLSWVHVVSKRAGQIQIIPGPEASALPFLSPTNSFLDFGSLASRGYVPEWISIRYKAGFERRLQGTFTGAKGQKLLSYAPANATDDALTSVQAGSHLVLENPVTGDIELHRIERVRDDTGLFLSEVLDRAYANHAEVNLLEYDPAMLEAIGIMASLPLLDTAGDLIVGAGISSQSISIDGLSQSVSTTSGVENSGYGARAVQYRKRLEDLDQAIRRSWRRTNFFAI